MKIERLPAETEMDLRRSHSSLTRVYAHLLSMDNFAKLLDRKAAKAA